MGHYFVLGKLIFTPFPIPIVKYYCVLGYLYVLFLYFVNYITFNTITCPTIFIYSQFVKEFLFTIVPV